MRKAKIVATLGPSSSSAKEIEILVKAGVDVFRLNFSHGTHDDHKLRYQTIRKVEDKVKKPLAILADLQGPKLRVGTFTQGSVVLKQGQSFTLDSKNKPGNGQRVYLPHPELFKVVAKGQNLLIDDGKVRLKVIGSTKTEIKTEVVVGGAISNRKGVNVPDAILPIKALTAKDKIDLEFALSLGVDWIALSFVQRAEDIHEARHLVKGKAWIMSKLEKPAALKSLDAIIQASDGVMVARGDLGVELPPEKVPQAQKNIIALSKKYGRPVVVATQMLESMINTPVPTRAEASDVAHAIYDGADAVMLSAESASGKYPVEAVTMMDKIVSEVEQDPGYSKTNASDAQQLGAKVLNEADAICGALRDVAQAINAAAIVTYTSGGYTSLRAARQRPDTNILSITPNISTARRLCMVWGVRSVIGAESKNIEEMERLAIDTCLDMGFKAKKKIAISAGIPFGKPGSTNLLKIAELKR
jgi:pyruvate kinase